MKLCRRRQSGEGTYIAEEDKSREKREIAMQATNKTRQQELISEWHKKY